MLNVTPTHPTSSNVPPAGRLPGADPTKLNFGNSPELNQAFCDAMDAVYRKYPEDNDVAAVYVEGLMNLKPWALWKRETVNGELQITAVDRCASKPPLFAWALHRFLVTYHTNHSREPRLLSSARGVAAIQRLPGSRAL